MLRKLVVVALATAIMVSGCATRAVPAVDQSPTAIAVATASHIIPPTVTPEPRSAASVQAPATPAATPPAGPTATVIEAPASGTGEPGIISTPEASAVTPVPTTGPTPDGTERTLRVPILMYHYISQPPPGADIYRRDLSVAPDRFESHLAYLRDAGYHVITLDDLIYALSQGRPLPEKPVILTFDDGYVDNYANAFPLLQKYADVGHFFLITDFVNESRPEYMTWAQIEEMAAAGQQFGSHSRNHPDLRGKSVDYLVWQALGGEESIQEHLGYHPRWIAFPSGGYDERTIAVYKSANYWGGVTTNQGATQSSSRPFELSRVRVRGTYTNADLARLLELNW